MATKKKAKRKTLQARVNELQKTAEKTIRQGVDRTVDLLPPAPRKTVKGWVVDLDKARVNLRKRTDTVLRDARKSVDRVTSDVQKRVDRVTTDVQKRVEKAVAPVTRNFDFASRKDIDSLRKRIDQIEHRLTERATSHEHSALA